MRYGVQQALSATVWECGFRYFAEGAAAARKLLKTLAAARAGQGLSQKPFFTWPQDASQGRLLLPSGASYLSAFGVPELLAYEVVSLEKKLRAQGPDVLNW